MQDMLCTLAKRVLDSLDDSHTLVDMFDTWTRNEIMEYESVVEYAYKASGAKSVDEEHVENDYQPIEGDL
jgi:hypothetical protein